MGIERCNDASSEGVKAFVRLLEVATALSDLGIEALVKGSFSEGILGAVLWRLAMTVTDSSGTTYNILYRSRVHDLDLVRRDADERSIPFVKWELVILTSSISHSTEVP